MNTFTQQKVNTHLVKHTVIKAIRLFTCATSSILRFDIEHTRMK